LLGRSSKDESVKGILEKSPFSVVEKDGNLYYQVIYLFGGELSIFKSVEYLVSGSGAT